MSACDWLVYLVHPDDGWLDSLLVPVDRESTTLLTGEVGRIDGVRIIKYKLQIPLEQKTKKVRNANQDYRKFGKHWNGGRR